MGNPKSTVVLSLLTSGVLIGGSQLLNGQLPTYRQMVGVFIVYLFLSVGVEITPDLAALFSLLVLTIVFLETFGKIAPGLNNFFSGKRKPKGPTIGGMEYIGPKM